MSTEERIIIQSRKNCPILDVLAKRWMHNSESGGQTFMNPADYLRSIWYRMIVLFIMIFVAEVSLVYMYAQDGYFSEKMLLGFAFMAIIMLAVCASIILPHKNSRLYMENAKEFAWTLSMIERHVVFKFSYWNIGRTSDAMREVLANQAKEIDTLRTTRKGQRDASLKYREWQRFHRNLRRLFTELPNDFRYYLPKNDLAQTFHHQ